MILLVFIILLPYIFVILKAVRGLSKIESFIPVKKADTFVSVIIPCRNEEKSLPALLDCISRQDYDPSKFEVIVVNDNSSDNTATVALAYRGINNIRVISNSGKGKKRAIREGVGIAEGELIITCDADCIFSAGWISTIASFYEKKKTGLIIAPVKISRSNFAPWFQKLEFLSLQGITAGAAINNNPVMCNGANLAFRKECYNKYSSHLIDKLVSGDDMFLLQNIKRNKEYDISWLESKETIASTEGSTTWKSFLAQRARWISKAGSYNDSSTTLLSMVTLLAVILQISLFCMTLFDIIFLKAFLAALIIKSIPDYLILNNTTKRYGEEQLMRWFIPCQLVYPFYVLSVAVRALTFDNQFTTR